MTFMPKFSQSLTQAAHDDYAHTGAQRLVQLSQEGLSGLLVTRNLVAPESVYTTRLDTELSVIVKKGFVDYFLIVADYVRWAKDNGIAVGPGRGSGPCSLVGFALGITTVDPIQYDLPFERFINPDRDIVPDFDIDFCDERAGEVVSYIQAKYGAERVARISTDDAIAQPTRLVIGDRPLTDLVPLHSTHKSRVLTTPMTVAQIRDAGLVQFNVINQKALSVIQRTLRKLAKKNKIIDIDQIPLDDSRAYRLLRAGEASNIALLDGDDYKNALRAIRPDRFDELCAVIALCYPRLRGSLSIYVERKQHSESIHYFHGALKSITAQTYGVILYQEQLMHITHKIAGFSMSQGDFFRRALRKSDSEAVFIYKKRFVDGAIKFGLSTDESTRLFEHLALSGRNTFNQSHAVAFAMIAYQTAWLKAWAHK